MKKVEVVDAGLNTTTPNAKVLIQLLGGLSTGSLVFTHDEIRTLNKLYGFTPEKPSSRPPKPVRSPDPEGTPDFKRQAADEEYKRAVAAWEKWEDPQPLMQAGADRNMFRFAEHDGLRLIAWLAKFVPAGEDPLKTLIHLALDAGYDVSPEDLAYAEADGYE